MAYLGEHQTYTGFNFHQSFGQWLKFLANLANLTNLLSRNLWKTHMFIPASADFRTTGAVGLASLDPAVKYKRFSFFTEY